MSNRPWTVKEQNYVRERYGIDATAEIAARLGRSSASVKSTANRLGCKSQRDSRRVRLGDAEGQLRELHAKGWLDSEIAVALFVDSGTIQRWRSRLGLPAQCAFGQHTPRLCAIKSRSARRRRQREARDSALPPIRDDSRSVLKNATDSANTLVYDDDTRAFLKAVDAFTRRKGRQPDLVEGFRLAKELGWRKEEVA